MSLPRKAALGKKPGNIIRGPMTTTTSAAGDALHVLRERGFVQQLSDEAGLQARFGAGPVCFYAGFDPTADSLHVGSLVPIMAMAHLARAGHRPIAILGGGTAMVGDPAARPRCGSCITQEAIQPTAAASSRRSARRHRRQGALRQQRRLAAAAQLHRLPARHRPALQRQRMLGAEAYKLRLEKGLSFIEFNYQLLQAYDFLVLNEQYGCALQIGGDDQWGNIVAGIDLIRRVRRRRRSA